LCRLASAPLCTPLGAPFVPLFTPLLTALHTGRLGLGIGGLDHETHRDRQSQKGKHPSP
jgi:hypothetical protein